MWRLILTLGLLLSLAAYGVYQYQGRTLELTFGNPSPGWCVGVTNVTQDSHIRYTSDGTLEGNLKYCGALNMIPLSAGNTYGIRCTDVKSGNIPLEFHVVLSDKDEALLCFEQEHPVTECSIIQDRQTIESVRQWLSESVYREPAAIYAKAQQLAQSATSTIGRAPIPLKGEMLLLLHPLPESPDRMKHLPFLYLRVE